MRGSREPVRGEQTLGNWLMHRLKHSDAERMASVVWKCWSMMFVSILTSMNERLRVRAFERLSVISSRQNASQGHAV